MTSATSYASEVIGEPVHYEVDPNEGRAARLTIRKHDDTMHAAGGTYANVRDLARWLRIHLNEGRIDGRQVFPATAIAEVHRPLIEGRGEAYGPFGRDGYALGWQTGTYDDDPMLHHFGSYAGAFAHISFMPTRDLGVVVVSNESFVSGRFVGMMASFAYDWWDATPDMREAIHMDAGEALAATREELGRVLGRMGDESAEAGWTLSLPAYTGVYVNDDYGKLMVTVGSDLTHPDRMDVRIGRLHSAAIPSPVRRSTSPTGSHGLRSIGGSKTPSCPS